MSSLEDHPHQSTPAAPQQQSDDPPSNGSQGQYLSASAIELDNVESEAWHGLLRAHRAIVIAIDSRLEDAHGLQLSSYEVLLALDSAPKCQMRMSELADKGLLTRSGMTRLVDRLEKMDLLTRKTCSADARGSFAAITPKGRQLLIDAHPTYNRVVREFFLGNFSEEELKMVVQCWERFPTNGNGPI